jgi:RNA polymerase sigma factor (sigma-70 family)
MEKQQEIAIIGYIKSGDSTAFATIVDEYKKLVAHIVFRMINNTHIREDLCQDVFLKVYQNLKNFQFQSKLSTWIATIAYNRCINYLEKKKVPLLEDNIAAEKTINDFSIEANLPDAEIIKEDVSNRIHKAMDKLPIKYKTALTLYHLDEMKYDEIGNIMNVPEGTVKSYLFRGRKLLKNILAVRYAKEELLS